MNPSHAGSRVRCSPIRFPHDPPPGTPIRQSGHPCGRAFTHHASPPWELGQATGEACMSRRLRMWVPDGWQPFVHQGETR
jgi:hypothetical protein